MVTVPNVDLSVVPEIARPDAVTKVLAEAIELRDRLSLANDELAALKAELEQQEAADVERAAKRIRSGEAPGNLSAAIEKTRHALAMATRNRDAIGLAFTACRSRARRVRAGLERDQRQHGRRVVAQVGPRAWSFRSASQAGVHRHRGALVEAEDGERPAGRDRRSDRLAA